MDIKEIFKRYVGQEIKDPERLACDIDPMANRINQTARNFSLTLAFCKRGQTRPSSPDLVIAHIEPVEGKSLWQVKEFTPS